MHEPTLADLAAAALAEKRTEDCHDNRVEAAAAERYAHRHTENTFGANPAERLGWEHTFTAAREHLAARAHLYGTPNWYLRWAGDQDGTTTTFELHRPCPEGGHRDPIHGLSELGEFLELLNNR
ncbi:hypothetical protein ACIQ9P_03700 [Kitasatospora sp. NPDC094019]|uniref:hypothetical protein n=1 Tax=Kitasatospora sp. NPDC094019 TaxID=3364091 RepID=UPI003801618A